MKYILGIDTGTQSTKVIFYDPESHRIAAEASAPHEIIVADGGHREQKAEWWTEALNSALKKIPEEIRSRTIAAGVSGQQHGFVPLDASGNVLSNVKLWCDTATAEECEEIMKRAGGADACLKETGNTILPGYTASKILWLKKKKPDVYKYLSTILLPHDYINFFLTGKKVMECGDASGTGLLKVPKKTWSAKICKAIDPEKDLTVCLPSLIASHESAGNIQPKAAEYLGLPAGIPVSSGSGDNMMGAIGMGAVEEGIACISLGTSGTLFAYSKKPAADPSGNAAAFCSATGGWLPLICTMNCTAGTELFRKLFDLPVKELDAQAAQSKPGSLGIIMLPYFNGERTPNLPYGSGCVFGLTPANLEKPHILRAAMESAVFGLRYGMEIFNKMEIHPKEIRITGGGSKSQLWRQICADILGMPIHVPENSEGAAFGAALQALWMLRVRTNIESPQQVLKELITQHVRLNSNQGAIPIPAHTEIYNTVYKKYLQYAEALSPFFKNQI